MNGSVFSRIPCAPREAYCTSALNSPESIGTRVALLKGGEPVKKLSVRKLEVIKTTAALYALGCTRAA